MQVACCKACRASGIVRRRVAVKRGVRGWRYPCRQHHVDELELGCRGEAAGAIPTLCADAGVRLSSSGSPAQALQLRLSSFLLYSDLHSKRELVRWIPLVKRNPNPPSDPTHDLYIVQGCGVCGGVPHRAAGVDHWFTPPGSRNALQTSDWGGSGCDGFV
jgi:hypothetical protein